MSEIRGALRTRIALRVKVSNDASEWIFRTVDVSDDGIFIAAGNPYLSVGDEVMVQVQDLPEEAPVVRMRVVQATPEGYDLIFIPG